MPQEPSKQEPVWTFRAAEHLILLAQGASKVLGISRSAFIRRAIEAAVVAEKQRQDLQETD